MKPFTLTILPRDLAAAIKARSKKSYNLGRHCLLAQAARRRGCKHYVGFCFKIGKTLYETYDTPIRFAISAFDNEDYDKARAMLPLKHTFK